MNGFLDLSFLPILNYLILKKNELTYKYIELMNEEVYLILVLLAISTLVKHKLVPGGGKI